MSLSVYARSSMVLATITVLAGCVTNSVNLAYRPEAEHKSALSAIKPLVFAIQVDDQREPADRARVAIRWKGGGSSVEAPIVATRGIPLVLLEALTAELENNGHRLGVRGDTGIDAALNFELKKYWCCELRVLGAFESAHVAATIHGRVEILNARNEQLLSKPISSTYLNVMSNRPAEYEPMLNAVLSEFVRNLARDPSTINALRRIQREQKDISSP